MAARRVVFQASHSDRDSSRLEPLRVTGEAHKRKKCPSDSALILHNVRIVLASQAMEKLVAAVVRGQAGQSL
jgi:hypothetical protein